VLAGRIGGWLRRRQAARRRIDTATGGTFIGLGVRLAADR
jgi:threonine/homoserine/homoserine lactone efflux protein